MKKIVLLLLLVLPLGGLLAAEVRVSAQLASKDVVYSGDRFWYRVIIDGIRAAGDVDTSPLASYLPKLMESKDYSGSSTTIINGRRTQRVTKRFVMTYSLLANKAGVIGLPGVNVTVEGKVYKTNPVNVRVVAPKKYDKFALVISVSKKKCYAGEPVEISLKWYVHGSVTNAVGVNGVSLSSPVFDSGDFYIERIINESEAMKNKNKFVDLQLNGMGVPFAQRGVKIKGEAWIELSYSAVFIAKYAGNIVIEPSRVLADIADGPVVSRSFFGGNKRETNRYMAESKGASLEVVALPDVARPKEAYGLVGNYTISSSATPTTVDVGQPITLSVTVGGSRLLSPVRWPDLESMEGFAGGFKVSTQREDPIVQDSQKIFTMTIRAGNDSITEIPSIPLVFFDTDKGKYVTAKSMSIPLKVSHSDVVTFADAEISGKGTINSQVEAVKKGMAANVVDIELVSQEFSPVASIVSPGYLALWGLPFVMFVVSGLFKLLTNTSDAKVTARRRKRAHRNAEGLLRAAKNKQDVAAAMREYIGWRFGVSGGALTGMDCERIIVDATGDAEVAKEYRVIFDVCEAAYYTGGGGQIGSGEIEKIMKTIDVIDKKSKK